jgi:DNA-binding NarL/FixJ family response regulator
VRAVLVYHNAYVRRGLRVLLTTHGVRVVAEASNDRAGVRLAAELRPDVVVFDADLPRASGAIAKIGQLDAGTPVFVLAGGGSPAALDALLAGAVGVQDEDAPAAQIADGVKAAALGDCVLSPTIAGRLVNRARELDAMRRATARPMAAGDLSLRESDVLRLVAAGHGNAMIAEQLYISSSTVKGHVASIIEKLGVSNRVEAAVEAVRTGLVV